MSKIFIKYCFLAIILFIFNTNNICAMNKDSQEQRKITAARKTQQPIRDEEEKRKAEEKQKLADQQEENRREALKKVRVENEKKRQNIRNAEQEFDETPDKGMEKLFNAIEETISGKSSYSREKANALLSATISSLEKSDNLENNARNVLILQALARYFSCVEGDIDSTTQCFKGAARYDPDSAKFYDILIGLKSKEGEKRKRDAQQRKTEEEKAKEMVMNRGIMIGAGTVAALVATWWGFSYIFGNHTSSPGNM